MPKLRIAVDMDGVVYDFVSSARAMLLDVLTDDLVGPNTGIRQSPTPTESDWTSWKIERPTWYKAVTDNAYRVFSHGGFIPRAAEGLHLLSSLNECDFFFCTRPWGEEGSEAWSESIRGRQTWLSSTPFSGASVAYTTSISPNDVEYDLLIDDRGAHIDQAIEGGSQAFRIVYPPTSNTVSRNFVPTFTDLYQAVRAVQNGMTHSSCEPRRQFAATAATPAVASAQPQALAQPQAAVQAPVQAQPTQAQAVQAQSAQALAQAQARAQAQAQAHAPSAATNPQGPAN